MGSFDLICNDCRHRYHVESDTAWVEEDKHCPKCGSDAVHQTFKSYFRNGPLFTEESLRNARYKGSCCCCNAYSILEEERRSCER